MKQISKLEPELMVRKSPTGPAKDLFISKLQSKVSLTFCLSRPKASMKAIIADSGTALLLKMEPIEKKIVPSEPELIRKFSMS